MICSFHAVVLLSLTVIGLTSCAGSKALSKGTPSAVAGTSLHEKGAPPAVAGVPPDEKGAPSAAAGTPPADDAKASRDAYWGLAMQRYSPPAKGADQPAVAGLPKPETPTTVTPAPTVATTPSVSQPAIGAVPAHELNPADIPFATWAPGKRGIVKSPYDPNGRLIDVRDFNAGQLAQCPYSGKPFRVPPLK